MKATTKTSRVVSWSRRMDRRHDAFGTHADAPSTCQACKQPLTPETALAVHPHYDGTADTLEFCTATFNVTVDSGNTNQLQVLLCRPCSHRYHQTYDKTVLAASLEGSVWEGASIV